MTPALWYYDVISPFAYLAFQRLGEIEAKREVVLKPVVFAGLLKHWGQLGPAEIAPKRIQIYRQCQFLAAANGIPFRMPPQHPFSPLAALRLLVALGSTRAAAAAAFEAIWGAGGDATDPGVLAAIAATVGDPAATDRIADPEVKAELAANGAEAIANNVFGVPTLLIDGETFWGYDAIDMALAYLDDPAMFSHGPMAEASRTPVGVERRR